jgi:hypothetical protein
MQIRNWFFGWGFAVLLLHSNMHSGMSAPRPPQPPWPEPALRIYGFDSGAAPVPWRDAALNESEAYTESWSGYALVRDAFAVAPVVIPLEPQAKRPNFNPTAGAIRFWLSPNWSTADKATGGTGPGHVAQLLQLVALDTKSVSGHWSLCVNDTGDTLYLVTESQGKLATLLQSPVQFTAGDWRMITLGYSATNTALWLDHELQATGAGLPGLTEAKADLALVVGSDFFAGADNVADAQFEELTTLPRWPKKSDWHDLYFQSGKRRSLLGPLGTKEEEQSKVTALKSAGFLPEEYGMAAGGGAGDGPIVLNNYAAGTLWLEITGVSNSLAQLIVHGTIEDEAYEIWSVESLTNAGWAREQPIVLGAAGQDWTPTTVAVGERTNQLFFRARTLVDTDGDGLADWWEMENGLNPNDSDTGTTGVPDGYKDGDNDGWSNLQEYQNGTSPGQFNTPAAPRHFAALVETGGTVANLTWEAAPGAVVEYVIERADPSGFAYQEVARVESLVHSYLDSGSFYAEGHPDDYWLEIAFPNLGERNSRYRVQATYANGVSSPAHAILKSGDPDVSLETYLVRGPAGRWQLVCPALPPAVTGIQLFWDEWDYYWGYSVEQTIQWLAASNFSQGAYTIPDADAVTHMGHILGVRGVGVGNQFGAVRLAGVLSSDAPYFVDGRTHLKENLSFLVRAAGQAHQFLAEPNWSQWFAPHIYWYSSGPDHVEASFIHRAWAPNDYYNFIEFVSVNNLWPFTMHYQLRNYLYVTNDFWAFEFEWAPDFNPVPAPLLLTPTNVPYLTSAYRADPLWTLGSYTDAGVSLGNGGQTFSLQNGVFNLFGLAALSGLGINASPVYGEILPAGEHLAVAPGGSRTFTQDSLKFYYSEFAAPELLNVGAYYFARVYSPGSQAATLEIAPENHLVPLPLTSDFAVTNVSPLLILPVGHPGRIGGWAKLAISNGYSDKFAYLGQYFDKAFMTTNGVVTTNETGILSPYGEFFPTEPGRTALVTMPDLETGERGTATVYAVSLNLDANHDGAMDRNFLGPDQTSAAKPFRFWLNNDFDGTGYSVGTEGDADGLQDTRDSEITSQRDLEDFARLWVSGMPPLPGGQGYSVTLSSTGPGFQLFPAFEADGGIGYLTDTTTAANQITSSSRLALGRIAPGTNYIFPDGYFASYGRKHFLFEGVSLGTGEVTLTVAQGTNVLAETSVFIDLLGVFEMVERAHVENVTSGFPPSSLASEFKLDHYPTGNTDEAKQITIFVHGINNTEFDFQRATEMTFKRLYWAGYQGRVAGFRWPCSFLPTDGSFNPAEYLKAFNFNKGEFYAWKSADALRLYLQDVTNRLAGYQINLVAHSQGSVVVSEALKQGAPFDNYILSQAAIPAHCYDSSTNVPFLQKFVDAEAVTPTAFYQTNGGYHGYFESLNGNVFNFFNPQDYALATGTYIGIQANWEENHVSRKPEDFLWLLGPTYAYNSSNGISYRRDTTPQGVVTVPVTDSLEIKGLVSRTRSRAVGAQAGVAGAIDTTLNLQASFNFGLTREEHSAQFTRNVQSAVGYYQELRLQISP